MMVAPDLDQPIISVRGLVNRFGDLVVHDGVDLDVRRGEVLGVVGGSGSGKSVLMRTLIGLNRPIAGTVKVLGHDIAKLDAAGWRALRARWGVLFQDGALFSSLTVLENVLAPIKAHARWPKSVALEQAAVKVAMVGLPDHACARYPAELSGGMRKRAGLARALALDPPLLFLDEPTAGLDPIGGAAFDALLNDLRRSLGLTVVLVTHDLDTLHAVCDCIAVLVDHKLVVDDMAGLLRSKHPWIRTYFHGPRGRAALHAHAAHAARAERVEPGAAAG